MQDQFDTPVFTIWSYREFAALGCRCGCGRRNVVMLWQDICKRNLGIKTPREIKKGCAAKNAAQARLRLFWWTMMICHYGGK
tara:strand:- start:33022 stop:33267 length:246 start_codon:yes stop_codon:yes gene_type:complete